MRACVYEGEEGGGRDGGEGYGLEGRDLLALIEQLKQIANMCTLECLIMILQILVWGQLIVTLSH